MLSPNERLRIAREKARFASAKEAAEAMRIAVSTYVQHENGTRGIPAKRADRYGKFFHVPAEWILYGKGKGPTIPLEPSDEDVEQMIRAAADEIPPGTPFAEWTRLAAPILRAQLVRYRADREAIASRGESTSPDKDVQSPAPTKPDARV